jgi:microcystin-dependent protein
MKSTFKKISFILSVVLMSLAVSYALGAWQEPSVSPPEGNVSAPINISSTAQTKEGGLTLQGDFTAPIFYDSDNTDYYVNPAGQTLLAGDVGIGTTGPGAKLEVAGQVKITGGSPGDNKVLTSDASGLASWATGSGVPSGAIVMWSGTLATIPSGWQLCDGTSGTPDLRNRFIYGTSASEDPGATGGAHTYSLTVAQLPAHSHSASVSPNPHKHYAPPTSAGRETNTNEWHDVCKNCSTKRLGWTNSTYLSVSIGNTGSGDTIDNRPAYYKLAYIMKL